MKFKVVSNYDSDLNMFNSVLNCFPNNTKVQLTLDNDYDYLLVINGSRISNIQTPRENIIGLLQEPIGNVNYDRNLHFYCHKIYCQSSLMFNKYQGVIQTPLYMFYSNHNSVKNEYFRNFKDFTNRKKLCLIVSSIHAPNNPLWTNHNYHKRHKLVERLLNSDLEFDFYGRGWGNIKDRRYKGEIQNKHEILRKYEYSIAIENVCETNYVTEKMFDCILNNTVPLYYGCPNISDIYSKDSFQIIDIESENIIDIIKQKIKLSSETYKESIFESKKTYFEKLNLFNLMEKIANE